MTSTLKQLQTKHQDALARYTAANARGDIHGANMATNEANALGIEMQQLRERDTEAQRGGYERAVEGMFDGDINAGPTPGRGRSIGSQFINSETFKWLKETKHSRGARWDAPSSELMAATLTEDGASGGGLVVPHYIPGILPLPQRALTMADLIAPGSTNSNLVTYMRELTYTNAADTVAEAAAKPESALTFEAVSDPVRKIAHWIPVTEEMLEDVPALQSYLDTRLRLGVQLAEDSQLLSGSVVAPDIVGILNRTGLAVDVARGTDTNADAVLRQIAAIYVSTGLQPTGIVMNPTNWLTIQLMKTTDGEYIAGNGPFSAPQAPTLWGLPVALTPAITAGTALVGAFKTAAQLFRKGGLKVEASNSHSDFFTKNLVAIRAEERLALAVYRPAAFGEVTGLN
jgi:HK97 family phage major capsid protein